jgi:hypothetical protein
MDGLMKEIVVMVVIGSSSSCSSSCKDSTKCIF